MGRNDIEDALKRLDKLTQEEARMAVAETLKLTHIVINGMPTMLIARDLILNAYTSVRRKRNEGGGPTIGKLHRQSAMSVINPVAPG